MDMSDSEKSMKKAMKIASSKTGKHLYSITSFASNLQTKLGHVNRFSTLINFLTCAGVKSVSIQGQNDQLVLLGEGIDLAELTRELKKKVCHTSIIIVQAAPPQQPPQPNPMGQFNQMPHPMGQYNQMPPAIRCTCDSGFCGLCSSMSQQQTYQMVPSPYPPVLYCRDEPDGCRIL